MFPLRQLGVLGFLITGFPIANLGQAVHDEAKRMERVRLCHGWRHYWGICASGQHAKATGQHRKR